MSDPAQRAHVEARSADKPEPKPLSILWQRFVRFGMTTVVMLLYRLRLLGWLVRYLRELVLPSVRPPASSEAAVA